MVFSSVSTVKVLPRKRISVKPRTDVQEALRPTAKVTKTAREDVIPSESDESRNLSRQPQTTLMVRVQTMQRSECRNQNAELRTQREEPQITQVTQIRRKPGNDHPQIPQIPQIPLQVRDSLAP
jgi:hypothetical protein